MQTVADLIILGGGCAGLSLAMHLADLGSKCPHTFIVEARKTYENDRTWCFWENNSGYFNDLIQKSWLKIFVSSDDQCLTLNCGSTPYQMLPSALFYDHVLKKIAKNDRIRLHTSAPVLKHPYKIGNLWHVDTETGSYAAKQIIDTRPTAKPERGGAILWQSFLGKEIICDTDIFDISCVGLMEFYHGAPEQISFVYFLPISPNRALIEVTIFGPDPINPSKLESEIQAIISDRVKGAGVKLLRIEHGILPMGSSNLPVYDDKSYTQVGLCAGGARPSTGYAFQRIQKWALKCSDQISKGLNPDGHMPDPWLMKRMDRLFLQVIKARPEIAPMLFLAIFEKVDTKRIIRFLSDDGTLIDYAAIILALPAKPFIKEILAALVPQYLKNSRKHQK
jgi:lycopene beta-cyclase